MGKHSAISWTDASWNPWRGCHKVSTGCQHCYMFREQERYGRDPKTVVRAAPATFNSPLHWHEPMKVFSCSWSDFFIEEADAWRGEAWDIIRKTPHLTYQICTKRPENINARLPRDWGSGWKNVWLGVTVESQEYLWRLDKLAEISASLYFVSYEPSLGPVKFFPYFHSIKWVISGGESGPGCRAADLDWFRDVRDECILHSVAYFHKQNGGSAKVNGVWGGNELDGRIHKDFPQ